MKIPGLNIGLNVGTIAIGAAIVLFGPQLLAATGSILKSVAKIGIKGGLMMYEGGRELLGEAKESLEDIAAEAKQEVAEERKALPAKKKK